MGTIEGYLIIGKLRGVKYYYLSSTERWTHDVTQVSVGDLSEEKIELDMDEYPLMEKEYVHQKVKFQDNPYS